MARNAKASGGLDALIGMAGNVRGVEKVVADDWRVAGSKEPASATAPADAATATTPEVTTTPAAPTASVRPEGRFYTIRKGDTSWKIAATALGKGARHPEIFEANREVILDPDKIYPGQKIRIPG